MRLTFLFGAALLGAAVCSQAPEFMQQYKQRLGGAIDELARVVRHFDADARASGLSREQAIGRYSRSGDPFLAHRGRSMNGTITRWHRMSDHWRALDSATAASRLPAFVAGMDSEVVERTWDSYKPAIPTTLESLIYSGGGFLVTHLLFGSFLSLFRRERRMPPPEPERRNAQRRGRETRRYS